MNILAPDNPAWDLQMFVDHLKRRGVLISNLYDTSEPSLRIGCIGAITPDDMHAAVWANGEAMNEIGLQSRRAA